MMNRVSAEALAELDADSHVELTPTHVRQTAGETRTLVIPLHLLSSIEVVHKSYPILLVLAVIVGAVAVAALVAGAHDSQYQVSALGAGVIAAGVFVAWLSSRKTHLTLASPTASIVVKMNRAGGRGSR